MSRAIAQLELMYRTANKDFFRDTLPLPIITVQSTNRKSYGHSTNKKVWFNNAHEELEQYEINIAAEFLNEEIECTLDTLIHEMIHLYCRINNIKECSRGGIYHNKKFKELAEKCGLKTYYSEKTGWNTDHKGNEKLTEYALINNFYDIEIGKKTPKTILNNFTTINENRQGKSSTIKYWCPYCKLKIRATKNIDSLIQCKTCKCDFIRV